MSAVYTAAGRIKWVNKTNNLTVVDDHVLERRACKVRRASVFTMFCQSNISRMFSAHHAGYFPVLLCHSLMACSSPRENGVVSRNMSTPPLSNTRFLGSVRWWGWLFPSVPSRVTVTWKSSALEALTITLIPRILIFPSLSSNQLFSMFTDFTWEEVEAPLRCPVLTVSRYWYSSMGSLSSSTVTFTCQSANT